MTGALLVPISYDFAMHIVHSEVIFYITQSDKGCLARPAVSPYRARR